MATIRVSSNSQLSSALRSAGSGDTISLSGGTYSLSLKGENFGGAKITAASGANVTFSHVSLTNVQNLTFDNVDVSSQGQRQGVRDAERRRHHRPELGSSRAADSGMGFWVNKSDDVSFVNNTVKGFQTGLWLGSTDDLSVRNNVISDISLDGMIVGHVHDAVISGNSISLDVPKGRQAHRRDAVLQFRHQRSAANVTISNNRIETNNSQSHGIYMNNEIADAAADLGLLQEHHDRQQHRRQRPGERHRGRGDQRAEDHQQHPAAGYLRALQQRTSGSRRSGWSSDSTGVSITGNVVHKQPGASGTNWQLTNKAEPGWTISNNKIVSIGTSVKTAESLAPNAGAPDAVKAAGAASAATVAAGALAAPPSLALSAAAADGHADTFRFYGDKGTRRRMYGPRLRRGRQARAAPLRRRAPSTTEAGGNALPVSADGTFAKIDSLADLRELDQASAKVSVHTSGDTLVLDIAQAGGATT